MRIYNGAVLFVDILGVGALTKAKADNVTAEDFAAFGKTNSYPLRNQVFCAVLLSTFRKNLRSLATENLRIAQLSDCAFIWSEDVDELVEFARALFWNNLKSGLLCRGGMTYGEIVEPDSIGKAIGDFVCGEAVTRAVELERGGKGARIFIDREIGGLVFSKIPANVFRPVSSAIDFRIVDEYLWFAMPTRGNALHGVPSKHIINVIDATLRLRYAPHFRWNAATEEGRIHVGATIELMQMFAVDFCKRHTLPVPEFAFVSAERYMEMGRLQGPGERHDGAYAAMTQRAASYRKKHFRVPAFSEKTDTANEAETVTTG